MLQRDRVPDVMKGNERMSCHRCRGFMCPVDLLEWASGSGHDGTLAWRCVACGEIIDRVIAQNRVRSRDRRYVRGQKMSRQSIRTVPVSS
jgi:RNase P subunit RPR2